jgi:RHS repeat-associated protein
MDAQNAIGSQGEVMKNSLVIKYLLILFIFSLISNGAKASNVVYIYTDVQGTTLAEADSSGNIISSYDYRPYGILSLGSSKDKVGYTGHVEDADTGLVYMQARYYDPNVGRFYSTDFINKFDGDLYYTNSFNYSKNNPINNDDSNGMEAACVSSKQGCDNTAGESEINAKIGNAVYGFVSAFADKWNSLVHDGTPEGAPTVSDNGAQSKGATVGTIVVNGIIFVASGGEKSPENVDFMSPKDLVPTQSKSQLENSVVNKLAKDMKENGFDDEHPISTISVNGKNVILDGHHRVAAAIKANIKQIPVTTHPSPGAEMEREVWGDAMNAYHEDHSK